MYRTAHSFKFPISVKQNQSVEVAIPDMADDCTGQIRPLKILFGFVHKLWQTRNWNAENKVVTTAILSRPALDEGELTRHQWSSNAYQGERRELTLEHTFGFAIIRQLLGQLMQT